MDVHFQLNPRLGRNHLPAHDERWRKGGGCAKQGQSKQTRLGNLPPPWASEEKRGISFQLGRTGMKCHVCPWNGYSCHVVCVLGLFPNDSTCPAAHFNPASIPGTTMTPCRGPPPSRRTYHLKPMWKDQDCLPEPEKRGGMTVKIAREKEKYDVLARSEHLSPSAGERKKHVHIVSARTVPLSQDSFGFATRSITPAPRLINHNHRGCGHIAL